MRTIRRLFRFWLFSGLALLVGLVSYGYYWVIHGLFSSFSATVGAMSPKFLLAQMASTQTMVLAIGVVFLAFDLRARDRRDRVIEVLDSRPYSNVELVLGRFLGALIMIWGVAFIGMMIIQGIGHLGVALGWYVGEPAIWSSVWAYLLTEALPALAVTIAFVQVASLLSGNRLVAALLGLGLAIGPMLLSFRVPTYVLPMLAINGGFGTNPSEVAPQIWTAFNLMNRATVAALAVGLLAVAVAVHPGSTTPGGASGPPPAPASWRRPSERSRQPRSRPATRSMRSTTGASPTRNARANRSSTSNTSTAPSTSHRGAA